MTSITQLHTFPSTLWTSYSIEEEKWSFPIYGKNWAELYNHFFNTTDLLSNYYFVEREN